MKKYTKDFIFLISALILFGLSAIFNTDSYSYFNTELILVLVFLSFISFIISAFIYEIFFTVVGWIFIAIGPIIFLIISSITHPDVFNFLGWICLILEGGHILIKTV